MRLNKIYILFLVVLLLFSACKQEPQVDLQEVFTNPPESAKPWVFWYWIKAGVSKEGITADLEAMSENGIGGAYLIPIQGADDPPVFDPPVEQLTKEWWDMVEWAFLEAKRLNLKIAMHSCDGFAVAGGPWITPEMSMQKVVWSERSVQGNQTFQDTLPQPEAIRGYYKDIAVYAYPDNYMVSNSDKSIIPVITSNLTSESLQFLNDPNNTEVFRSKKEGWIQYAFDSPVTCRTIHIKSKGHNYAADRLIIESSDDGENFQFITWLEPPRHGWQDYEQDVTHSIPETTARYFRFTYTTEGAEPGSEDLDAARWSPDLKLQGLYLSSKPVIHQYEAKNGGMWRIAKRSNGELLPDSLCVPLTDFIDLTDKIDSTGILTWNVPEGNWTILRIGHTSTGHTNYIGGKGLGLECDKFDPAIAEFQFDQWFGKVFEKVDPELAGEVLKVFHIDSWECGSQNWSSVFREEFTQRRGYDIVPLLPVMTGLPINSAAFSEQVLYDVRETIEDLITENFFRTMNAKTKSKNCVFSSESVAPVMLSDAMTHYKEVDIPMGEFWFNSPSHDKPNDVLDAISAAHIYGKNIVQSEAFTTLRMDWNENPAMLKSLGDRNFALGVNKFVFHVFAHNPWMDKKPGMTLNTVGLYFQRDQTWWKHSKAWMDYLQRCQAMLQQGTPVVDVAVFTGEEYPRRALTPDRLIPVLPGLFGEEKLIAEISRLLNEGAPLLERPYSVTSSANTFDPANWIDPLRGYKYNSFNKDALLRLATVKDGKIVLANGQSYQVLVVPGTRKASPNNLISAETADKLVELVRKGATLVLEPMEAQIPGIYKGDQPGSVAMLYNENNTESVSGLKVRTLGKGRMIYAPYVLESLEPIGIRRDLIAKEDGVMITDIAWTHRGNKDFGIYFISNQQPHERTIELSLRISDRLPELFDPNTGKITEASYSIKNGRTDLSVSLASNESVFVVFRKHPHSGSKTMRMPEKLLSSDTIQSVWQVEFSQEYGGIQNPVEMQELTDWTHSDKDSIRYYSGIATYSNTFTMHDTSMGRVWLDLGKVHNTAEVFVNGHSCGIAWTAPYRIEITTALIQGENKLRIEVANGWKNRIIADNTIHKDNPFTYTTAPFRLKGHALAESGLMGPVCVIKQLNQ